MKSLSRGKVISTVAGLGILMVILGGAAWACTPSSNLTMIPMSGPVGTQINVSGNAIEPLEIRWNSAGGPVIGKVETGQVSLAVNVPVDASPGFYFVIVKERAIGIFQVTENTAPHSNPEQLAAASASGDLWRGVNNRTGVLGPSPEPLQGRDKRDSQLLGMGLAVLGAAGLISAMVLRPRKSYRRAPDA